MPTFNEEYWESRYQQAQTGWDIGSASTPIKSYISQLTDKNLKILIPGCGNAWEAHALLDAGFSQIVLLDFAASPLETVRKQLPQAVERGNLKLVCEDFFAHEGHYDLILEQTFFCALSPELRSDYARKMHSLLKPGGKLAGLLFQFPLTQEGPPFGGSEEEYRALFSPQFTLKTLEPCHNSIKPRLGRELFFILEKPC